VRPDFARTVLKSDHSNLEIKDSTSMNLERRGPFQQTLTKPGPWSPQMSVPFCEQIMKEVRNGWRRRLASGHRWMRHNAPEFSDAWQTNTPTLGMSQSLQNRTARSLMLRRPFTMSINENVRIDRDHLFLSNQSYMASRLDRSIPRGSPPLTVTRRTSLFLGRPPGFRRTSRRPSSNMALKGRRSEAALRFASINSSSGSSTVVFMLPYYHIYGFSPRRHTVVGWAANLAVV